MKRYDTDKIRNVAVLGHLGSGKTSFTESVLQVSGAKEKKGTVEEKNTASDYLVEEQNRMTSMSLSLIPAEHEGHKYNFIDTPGSEEFVGEINRALSVVKGAILVIDATKGIEVGTERLWIELNKRNIPTILFINKLDKENIKFEELINNINDTFGRQAVPFTWPIGTAQDFKGYVDLVDMKAYLFDSGAAKEAEIPQDLQDRVEKLREQIVESVAETSEELLEKYFEGEELTPEEIRKGLRQGVVDGELKPMVVGSATKDIGTEAILEMAARFMPAPSELKPMRGKNPETGDETERETKDAAPFSAYVFKTTIDPFIGSVNIFKVVSGNITSGKEVLVTNSKKTVKLGNIFTLQGKKQLEIDSIGAGDMGAVAKAADIHTGATITDPKNPIIFDGAELPSPTIYVAIHPKRKEDEDKISSALQKLNMEDPSFVTQRNKETAQLLLGGMGMTHIGYILEKMKNMYKVDVDTLDQKIAYRETIKKKTEGHGRHKKQTGGAGQFGEVKIRFEPLDPNGEEKFIFKEEIYGGAVPKNFHPAVEKGLVEAIEKGPLAGYPVIGLQAVLFDGSYHPVDSNEMAFKTAARLGLKDAFEKASPTILEPIMRVEILAKDDYVGDIMGDINKRRGRVLGMDPVDGGMKKITADIPEAEIVKYSIDLKAMTQGSGSFTRRFDRYEEVPGNLVEKIIEERKKAEEDKK